MSRSTFNGPVLVGIDNAPTYTSGIGQADLTTRPGPNWGFVNMSQSAPITQDTATRFPTLKDVTAPPTMVIPGNSTITRISVLVTTAWDGSGGETGAGTMDIGMGWTDPSVGFDRNNLVDNVDLTALGNVVIGPGDTDDLGGTPDDINNWMNMSMRFVIGTDRFICVDSAAAPKVGVGVLTVNYCQAVDLSAIA